MRSCTIHGLKKWDYCYVVTKTFCNWSLGFISWKPAHSLKSLFSVLSFELYSLNKKVNKEDFSTAGDEWEIDAAFLSEGHRGEILFPWKSVTALPFLDLWEQRLKQSLKWKEESYITMMVLRTMGSKGKDLDRMRKIKTSLNSSYWLTYGVRVDKHGVRKSYAEALHLPTAQIRKDASHILPQKSSLQVQVKMLYLWRSGWKSNSSWLVVFRNWI